jgi:hypothetical protein
MKFWEFNFVYSLSYFLSSVCRLKYRYSIVLIGVKLLVSLSLGFQFLSVDFAYYDKKKLTWYQGFFPMR